MIQDILRELSDEIKGFLKSSGTEEPEVVFEQSASPEFGEYSTNIAMRYARELKKNPFKLAKEVEDFLQEKNLSQIERVEAVKPGFVNVFLTVEAKVNHLKDIRLKDLDFGLNGFRKDEKWVIEHTSPNPNKAMHLGHLRNNLIGMSIVRMLERSGAKVVADCVYNNRGIAIAKVMFGFLYVMRKKETTLVDVAYWKEHKDEWFSPEEKDIKSDEFVTECYVQAERLLSEDEENEKIVRQMVLDWEKGDEIIWELWEYVLKLAYSGIDKTLSRLDSHWDNIWYEHEHYQKGKDYVEEGLKKGIFKKLEDGAVLTQLEDKYNIPETILLKNDGTSLYITQDIALTDLKKKTFDADKLVWVVGPDQSMAMRQMFAVCEQLGIGKLDDFTHVSYGYVGLRDEEGAFKKMSSRTGSVVLIDDVIDEAKKAIKTRLEGEERHINEDREVLAEKLAIAAVKFAFLKSDRTQDMFFDVEQSVDVQGDSGIYVMYTYVRTQSILRKAGNINTEAFSIPTELGEEMVLLRELLYFEEVVIKSVNDLSVHHVAQYLLKLCSEFNRWYAKETILDGSDRESYKVALVDAVSVTVGNALYLLGIATVDEM